MTTRTTNKLHFEDLEPIRFEDLAVNILYRRKNWKKILHIGRHGSDEGVDIEGVELKEMNGEILWYVQCKRYKSFTKKDFDLVISKIEARSVKPDAILLVISCSLSKKTRDYIQQELSKKGIQEYDIWGDSIIEAILYSDYPDLLNIYFGLSVDFKVKSKLELIEKRKSFRDAFRESTMKPFNPNEPLIGHHRFLYRKFIIRSVFDDDEETTQDNYGWYSYFGVEPHYIGDLGIQVDLDWKRGFIANDRGFVETKQKDNDKQVVICKRAHLPYENIYTYDFNNGSGRPLLYCKYNGELGPFDSIEWVEV
jgi:hypothetical protein